MPNYVKFLDKDQCFATNFAFFKFKYQYSKFRFIAKKNYYDIMNFHNVTTLNPNVSRYKDTSIVHPTRFTIIFSDTKRSLIKLYV